jgi:CubicO group peptidase (beta-lactamase class C family)
MNIIKKMNFKLALISLLLLNGIKGVAQAPALEVYNTVKDTIVARLNRGDYKGVYELADTAFSNHISESQLTGFLTGMKHHGRIAAAPLIADSTGSKKYYLLEFDLRNMMLALKLNGKHKFTSFGISYRPVQPLAVPRKVATNNPQRTKLDKTVDSLAGEYFRDQGATALSIGVIKAGQQFTYHYGETTKGNGRLPDNLTVYEIGSVTKTFTATLLARTMLRGKVDLNDDVRKYLGNGFSKLEYRGTPIRLRDLSNHTSRLPSLPKNFEAQTPFLPLQPYRNYTETLFWQAMREFEPDTLPGYKFEYSNMGFALLGKILEKVNGKSYEELLKRDVFQPLGMTAATTQLARVNKTKMASGYSENGKPIRTSTLGQFEPAGGIYANMNDMLQFTGQQISEKDQAVKLTHQLTQGNTGLSWGMVNLPDGAGRMLQHSGSTEGFNSNVTIFPEKGTGFVVMANNKININPVIVGLIQYNLK